MKARWTIAGIACLALVTLWVAFSTESLVGGVPIQTARQPIAAERRAEALRSGGLKEAAKVTGEYVVEIPGADWGGPATIPELVQESTVIVIGKTDSSRSRLNPEGDMIRSAYRFDVESVLKGKLKAQSVTVVLLGGRIIFDDGSAAEMRVANAERPVHHERHILFLRPPKGQPAGGSTTYRSDEFVPVWDTQGLYRLPGGGARVSPADRRRHGLPEKVRAMQPGQFISAVREAIRTGR